MAKVSDPLTHPNECAACPTEPGEVTAPRGLGYVAWHDWADEQERKGWTARECTVCGLYTVWMPPDKEGVTRTCRGVTAFDDRCWNRTKHISGLCHIHRHQMGSGDPDELDRDDGDLPNPDPFPGG